MKTKILLLLFFVSLMAEAKINLDSLMQKSFKPAVENYLKSISDLSEKIATATNKDSLRLYAKKIMRLSDKMEEQSNDFYSYGGKGLRLAPVFFSSGKSVSYGYLLVQNNGRQEPLATKRINKIYDCATNIRFFCTKNPNRIKKNLNHIKELKEDLRLIVA
jgi:hypothetical protein